MGSHHVDTLARSFYGPAFNAYLGLFRRSLPLSHLEKADVIFCIGLDTRHSRSVVGVEIRRAIKSGAQLITFHPRDHNLTLMASLWLQPKLGEEEQWLSFLARMTKKKGSAISPRGLAARGPGSDLADAARLLTRAKSAVILMGSEFWPYDRGSEMLQLVAQLADNIGAGILPLPSDGNLLGSLMMGAYPELLPGGRSTDEDRDLSDLGRLWGAELNGLPSRWDAKRLSANSRLTVLYLVGERLPQCHQLADYVIYQNIYPPNSICRAGLVLPAAAFTEVDGTIINGEGRLLRLRRGAPLPGQAKPDWEIFCHIAAGMHRKGFNFSSARGIEREIARVVDGFGQMISTNRAIKPMELAVAMSTASPQYPAGRKKRSSELLLSASPLEHTYRGQPVTSWVDGARRLFPETIVTIHPRDAQRIDIHTGDEVVISWGRSRQVQRARLTEDQPLGSLHVAGPLGLLLDGNPQRVRISKKR
jgi:predicted molibdopterin-dependent oxidoreductase YjgC